MNDRFEDFDRRFYELLKPYGRDKLDPARFMVVALVKFGKLIPKTHRPAFADYANSWACAHNTAVTMQAKAFLSNLNEKIITGAQEARAGVAAAKVMLKAMKTKKGSK